jgi:hypothetical protein
MCGQCVPVGHKKVTLILILQLNPVFQHTMKMAQMKTSGWAHPGDHALELCRNHCMAIGYRIHKYSVVSIFGVLSITTIS